MASWIFVFFYGLYFNIILFIFCLIVPYFGIESPFKLHMVHSLFINSNEEEKKRIQKTIIEKQ